MGEAKGFNRPIEFRPEHTPPKDFDRPIESAAALATNDPTRATYLGWGYVYNFYNGELFGGELPPCLITYQRSRKSYGYFAGDQFVDLNLFPDFARLLSSLKSATAGIDELAINPAHLHERPVEQVLASFVHDMAHLKRYRLVKPRPTPGYHDKKWRQIMLEVGLMPPATGEPGEKTTDQKVNHYIIPGGRFEIATQELLRRGFTIRYLESEQENNSLTLRRERSKASKSRFSCVNCQPAQNAWAKPSAHLICGDCNTRMLPLPSGGAK
jgi:ribosomal protein S27E